MVAMPIARRAGEHRHNDLRTERAHDRHHVTHDGISLPVRERLLRRLGEPEIIRARKELAPPIKSPCRKQLLRANHAKLLAKLVANEILTAITPRQREIGRLHLMSARQPRDEIGVLVVRMRADHQHAHGDVEPGDRFTQYNRAAFLCGKEARRNEREEHESKPA